MAFAVKGKDGFPFHLIISGLEREILGRVPDQLRTIVSSEDYLDRSVARLFPPAYHDREMNAEYQTYARDDIRDQKLLQIKLFEESLESSRNVDPHLIIELSEEQVDAWIAFSNDMRLCLGVDLGIDSNDWCIRNSENFRHDQRYILYKFLTHIQLTLLEPIAHEDFIMGEGDLDDVVGNGGE